MLVPVTIRCLQVVGLGLAILGAGLFLDVLSLRLLAELTRVPPAISIVFELRGEMSHRRAQAIELLLGLIGMTMLITGTWWDRSRFA